MPKKPLEPSIADESSAPGGVAAVDRALSLLGVFNKGDVSLGLIELSARTKLYKSTVLRLIASLEHSHLMIRNADATYSLGPEVMRLHAVYTATFSLESQVMPVLRDLVAVTMESAAFHVLQGGARLCLHRVDSPQIVRDHIRAGDLLPLNRGAGGRVLGAFSGEKGKIYDAIRKQGFVVMDGDRIPDLTGISSPVFNARGDVIGAVTLTLPTGRMKQLFVSAVRKSAANLSKRLGGSFPY